MSQLLRYELREGVALLTVTSPPVNALGQPVRAALLDAVERAEADPEVGALVIAGEGRTFPAGVDVRELSRTGEEPGLGALLDRIETCSKPVIAAIHGTALGSGLELALACHFRLAASGAQLGLPDVTLGVVPAAGGTQRLPRIVGAPAALDLILSGRPIGADVAEKIGLVDKAVPGNLSRAAFWTAHNMIRAGVAPRPSSARREGFRDPKAYLDAVAERRKTLAGKPQAEAPRRAVDLIEAALLLPFDEGLAMERTAFDDLVASPGARGLRHAFLVERRTRRGVGLSAPVRPVARVALSGHGPRLAAVGQVCLGAGLTLEVADEGLFSAVAEGISDAEALGRLIFAAGPEAQTSADLLIADPPTPEALAALGAVARADALLAVVDPEGDVTAAAAAAGRPGAVMRLIFAPPEARTRLVEVTVPANAAPGLAASGFALVRALGRVPVWATPLPGGVLRHLLQAGLAAAEGLLARGVPRETLEAALQDWGFGRDLFAIAESFGLGAVTVVPDGTLPEGETVAHAVVLAMAAEGARLIEAGVLTKPGDVDAVALLGLGYPRRHGGPMETADQLGLLAARNMMRGWGAELWAPGRLWEELLLNGREFDSLNG